MRGLFTIIVLVSSANLAFAGPLIPPSLVTNVGGESEFLTFGGETNSWIDWFVLEADDYSGSDFLPLVATIYGGTSITIGEWLYAYQVESNTPGGQTFTLDIPNPGAVIDFGWTGPGARGIGPLLDLDEVGHTESNFINLGNSPAPAEHEFGDQLAVEAPAAADLDLIAGNISWEFGPPSDDRVGIGEESTVLWIRASGPPIYDDGRFQNGSSGQGVLPTPAPAPGALPAGLVLLGVMYMARRRKMSQTA